MSRGSKDSHEDEADAGVTLGTIVACIVGAGVWAFLSSAPSPVGWIIAILILVYLVLGYCLLEIHLMEQRMGKAVPVQGQQPPPLQLDLNNL